MSYKKQELLIVFAPGFFVGFVLFILLVFVLSYYMPLRSGFHVVMSFAISAYKRDSVRLYYQFFIDGCMSYLRYLCLFVYSGVQHILCCGFVLFLFVLLPVSPDCPFLVPSFGIL